MIVVLPLLIILTLVVIAGLRRKITIYGSFGELFASSIPMMSLSFPVLVDGLVGHGVIPQTYSFTDGGSSALSLGVFGLLLLLAAVLMVIRCLMQSIRQNRKRPIAALAVFLTKLALPFPILLGLLMLLAVKQVDGVSLGFGLTGMVVLVVPFSALAIRLVKCGRLRQQEANSDGGGDDHGRRGGVTPARRCAECESGELSRLVYHEGASVWRYSNKDGSRDKRRKHNYRLATGRSVYRCSKCGAETEFRHAPDRVPSANSPIERATLVKRGLAAIG